MLSETEENLIQQYYTQTLNEADKQLFIAKLRENGGRNEFAQTFKLQQRIEQILQNNPVAQARLIVEKLGDDLFFDTPLDIAETEKKTETSYSLAELLAMFEPEAAWETATATRSQTDTTESPDSLQTWVVLPENAIECRSKDQLHFELEQAAPCELNCKVYNNHQEAVATHQIPAREVSFSITVPAQPGRFYWELTPTDRSTKRQIGTAKGMFFVERGLVPET